MALVSLRVPSSRKYTHAHGCAKLANDPGICHLVTKAGIAWHATQVSQDQQQDNTYQQLIEEGEKAKSAALEYADWLVTTMNEAIPDDTWSFPIPHPCSVNIEKPEDATDQDYHNLVNTVERHTRCSTAYCLRRKQGQQELKCRFDYPRQELCASTLTFERLENGSIKATLTTKRNDPRVNSHNRLMIQHWRANVDIQMIIDASACARYMTKYASKSEPRSKPVSTVFKNCVEKLSDSSDPHTALKSTMIRSAGERDFSAQETAHQLLSLPLVSCTYRFETLSLNNSRALSKDVHTGEHTIEPSLIDCYANRLILPKTNLITFASKYTVYKSEPRRRPKEVIIRTFPQYSPNPNDHNYSQYCKFQLIKYKPWKNNFNHAWSGHSDTEEGYIQAYHSFLQSSQASEYIPQFNRDLHLAQEVQTLATSSSEENDQARGGNQDEEEEEWMLLCRLNQHFQADNNEQHDNVNWCEAAESLPPAILQACPSWIRAQRSDEVSSSQWSRPMSTVDTCTLNTKQRRAYNIVSEHLNRERLGLNPPPLRMIVSGTAGTGKSYLISSIANLLGN